MGRISLLFLVSFLLVFSGINSNGQSMYSKVKVQATSAPAYEKIHVSTSSSDFATLYAIDFETETAWSFDFTPWTVNDVDGLTTYGFTGTTFPNSGDPMAYIVFDPATTDPPMTSDPEIQPHSGSQFGACMAAVPDGTQGNDDWFISDQVTITASGASFEFWAKSYTDDYGLEVFNVGVSTTGNSPSDFTIISGSSPVAAPVVWTDYSYDLSAYVGQSIYVAIQCVSFDAFVFMIDDLEIDPDGGGGGSTTCDDFDNLNVGDYVAVELSDWTTWNNSPGSSEDAQVTNTVSSSGANSIQVDGSVDLIRLFNSTNLYSGKYEFQNMIYVQSGNCGYFNLQKDVVAGTEWGMEVQFDTDGTATVNAGADAAATFSFNHNQWYLNKVIVDLDNNSAEYYFNGSLIVSWQWSLGANGTPGAISLGGANFFAWASTGNSPLAYYDDVCFEDITVFEPNIFVNPTALTINIGTKKKKSSTVKSPENGDDLKITADYIKGRVIVKFRRDVDVSTSLLKTSNESINQLNDQFTVSEIDQAFRDSDVNFELKQQFGLPQIYTLEFPKTTSIEEVIKAYSANPDVVYAEPDYIYKSTIIPPDPMYPDQWGLNNTGQAVPNGGGGTVGTPGADINAENAWDINTGSSDIIVAIIDEGVDLSHPEFSGRLLPGYDFYDNDSDPSPEGDGAHGTACAGIAAASNDGVGVVGVAWNVMILPVRVLGPGGGSSTQVANGITFSADEGADVLSLSLGGTGFSSTMETAVDYAYALDAIVLSAAGNDNTNNSSVPFYPAEYANSVSVGALSPCNDRKTPSTCDGESWWGSNYGGTLDFMAPGVRIYTTDISGSAGYTSTNYTSTFNGTSSACPFAAGIAALIRSENPSLTNQQVWDIMQSTCVDLETAGYDIETGYGRLDAYEALLSAGGSVINNTFQIQNIGNQILSINSITDDKNWLSTSGYPATPFDITPGGGQDITVDIDWGLLGPVQQTGTITIASNDPDEPSAYVTVTAIPGAAPDLIVENQSINPTTAGAGDIISSLATVTNVGDTVADPSTLKYYLSDDTLWDASDTYLSFADIGSLAVGASSTENTDLTIPTGTSAGTHYILFFADAEEVVLESNEDNNIAYSQLEVLGGLPDLIVENQSIDPTSVEAGGSINATSDVTNIGASNAAASTLKYYLSSDTAWDDSDDLLGSDDVGSLDAGASSAEIKSLIIPAGTIAGLYYILFFADADLEVDETNEDNNVSYAQLVVTTSSPYLILDPTIKNVGGNQGYFAANVLSNINWSVSESCDWLSCDPLSGQNDGTFVVLYEENTTGSIRSYTIVVSGEGLSENLIVVQDYTIGIEENDFDKNVIVYPNPFTSKTTIEYNLEEPQRVEVSFYNHLGERIEIIANDHAAGKGQVQWDATGLPNGLYFYRIEAGNKTAVGKILKAE